MRWIAALCVLAVVVGWSLLGGGVFLLAGVAWTLVVASVPFIAFAFFLFRGLTRAE